jgi:hypothetical protein
MSSRRARDLLVIARERSGLYDAVQRLSDFSGVEIRIDGRRTERRRPPRASPSEERRQRERRAFEVSDQLGTDGWVFITAADRS